MRCGAGRSRQQERRQAAAAAAWLLPRAPVQLEAAHNPSASERKPSGRAVATVARTRRPLKPKASLKMPPMGDALPAMLPRLDQSFAGCRRACFIISVATLAGLFTKQG